MSGRHCPCGMAGFSKAEADGQARSLNRRRGQRDGHMVAFPCREARGVWHVGQIPSDRRRNRRR